MFWKNNKPLHYRASYRDYIEDYKKNINIQNDFEIKKNYSRASFFKAIRTYQINKKL